MCGERERCDRAARDRAADGSTKGSAAVELDVVVRGEDPDLAGVVPGERAQALLVGDARGVVDGDGALEDLEADRAPAAVGIHLAAVEVGVAAVEEPGGSAL